eukprot:SAG31_NODE_9109_length_1334_cov_1.030794_2_plen_87_part_00
MLEEGGKVSVYEGTVKGTIVPPRGDSSFGFDPVFQPDGSTQTLAEAKPDKDNARFRAVELLVSGKVSKQVEPIRDEDWAGAYQHDD